MQGKLIFFQFHQPQLVKKELYRGPVTVTIDKQNFGTGLEWQVLQVQGLVYWSTGCNLRNFPSPARYNVRCARDDVETIKAHWEDERESFACRLVPSNFPLPVSLPLQSEAPSRLSPIQAFLVLSAALRSPHEVTDSCLRITGGGVQIRNWSTLNVWTGQSVFA